MSLTKRLVNACIVTCFVMQTTVVSCADIRYLNDTIKNYFADTRHHGSLFSDYKARAKEFIFNEFKRFGLATEYQHFKDIAFGDTTFTNVIGVLKGVNIGKKSDKILQIFAHYDTVSTTKGVDDNGSGMAAILEVAKQLQNSKGKHTIMFVATDLGEFHFSGSAYFFTFWLPNWLRKKYNENYDLTDAVQGCIALDTVMEFSNTNETQSFENGTKFNLWEFFPDTMRSVVSNGYKGDFLTMVYRRQPQDSAVAENFKRSWETQGREEFKIESFDLPGDENVPSDEELTRQVSRFLNADHINCWKKNLPAILITDSADFRGDMRECYHNPCDNIERMLTDENVRFLGKTVDSVVTTINRLAEVTAIETGGSEKINISAMICIGVVLVSVMFLLGL